MARITGFTNIQKHLAAKIGESTMRDIAESLATDLTWKQILKARSETVDGDIFSRVERSVRKKFFEVLPKSFLLTRLMKDENCGEHQARSMLHRYCLIIGYPLIREKRSAKHPPNIGPGTIAMGHALVDLRRRSTGKHPALSAPYGPTGRGARHKRTRV